MGGWYEQKCSPTPSCHNGGSNSSTFVLIVVLFILLIIVGTVFI